MKTFKLLSSMLAIVAMSAGANQARATYSIVAVDSQKGMVGGAGVSCTAWLGGGDLLDKIHAAVPGVGVIHSQAMWNLWALRAVAGEGVDGNDALFKEGVHPTDINNFLHDSCFEGPGVQSTRQYGIINIYHQMAQYTGSANPGPAKGSTNGDFAGRYAFAVQGNTLTSDAVFPQAKAGFENTGCDFVEKLVNATIAAAQNGQGDARCRWGGALYAAADAKQLTNTTVKGPAGDDAFVRVYRPDGSIYFEFRQKCNSGNASSCDPIEALKTQFAAWRAQNACDSAPDVNMSMAAAPVAGADQPLPWCYPVYQTQDVQNVQNAKFTQPQLETTGTFLYGATRTAGFGPVSNMEIRVSAMFGNGLVERSKATTKADGSYRVSQPLRGYVFGQPLTVITEVHIGQDWRQVDIRNITIRP